MFIASPRLDFSLITISLIVKLNELSMKHNSLSCWLFFFAIINMTCASDVSPWHHRGTQLFASHTSNRNTASKKQVLESLNTSQPIMTFAWYHTAHYQCQNFLTSGTHSQLQIIEFTELSTERKQLASVYLISPACGCMICFLASAWHHVEDVSSLVLFK